MKPLGRLGHCKESVPICSKRPSSIADAMTGRCPDTYDMETRLSEKRLEILFYHKHTYSLLLSTPCKDFGKKCKKFAEMKAIDCPFKEDNAFRLPNRVFFIVPVTFSEALRKVLKSNRMLQNV